MGLIANQIPLCYPPSTATAVLLAQPSQQESSVTPKDKSFLQLHWLEQPVSLDIAGAAPDRMSSTTLHVFARGVWALPAWRTSIGYATWEWVPPAVGGSGRGH